MRFAIRDLLWLTLVVALAIGWWFDHTRRATPRYEVRHVTGAPAGSFTILQDNETGQSWVKQGDSWVNGY